MEWTEDPILKEAGEAGNAARYIRRAIDLLWEAIEELRARIEALEEAEVSEG